MLESSAISKPLKSAFSTYYQGVENNSQFFPSSLRKAFPRDHAIPFRLTYKWNLSYSHLTKKFLSTQRSTAPFDNGR